MRTAVNLGLLLIFSFSGRSSQLFAVAKPLPTCVNFSGTYISEWGIPIGVEQLDCDELAFTNGHGHRSEVYQADGQGHDVNGKMVFAYFETSTFVIEYTDGAIDTREQFELQTTDVPCGLPQVAADYLIRYKTSNGFASDDTCDYWRKTSP